jgi:Tfp pilus assembly protein PilF
MIVVAVLEKLIEGVECLNRKDYDHAVACFEAVLESEPSNSDALMYLAKAFALQGMWGEAERYCHQLVDYHPTDAKGYSNWGMALRKLHRFDQAKAAQERALAISPDLDRARLELRKVQRDSKRLRQAGTPL